MAQKIIDTHVHILWPQRYGYPEGPGYKPTGEIGDPDALMQMMAQHEISHALLVQPGGYGFDNRPIYDTIGLHPKKFKGIGAFPLTVSRQELSEAKKKGVIGVRLNLYSFDASIFQNTAAADFLKNCRDENLFVEVFAPSRFWPEIGPILRKSGVSLVIEHMGWPDVAGGTAQAGFSSMLEMADLPEVAIKLTCGFRLSSEGPPYRDLLPFASEVIGRFGIDRCLWGSDWPFLKPEMDVSVTQELSGLSTWLPLEADRTKVLCDNPLRIFGFE